MLDHTDNIQMCMNARLRVTHACCYFYNENIDIERLFKELLNVILFFFFSIRVIHTANLLTRSADELVIGENSRLPF